MKIPGFVIPVLVIIALFGGYFLRYAFTQPTTNIAFQQAAGSVKIECIVEGVKCKGTANYFTKLYEKVPGIAAIETFATEHKAIFTYDPAQISQNRIKEIMEAPIPLRDGTSQQFFKLLSVEKM